MTKQDYKEILVVEDTPANLQLLTHILEDNGYRVRPVSTGSLALRSIAIKKPDFIILDIKMPDINGYEICRKLKTDKTSCKIPVIFMSALGETVDKVKGFKLGGVDYITKPFEPEEVLARISTHLKLYQLTEDMEEIIKERTEKLKITNEKLRKEILCHKRARELLYKSNKAYRALSDCNQALVRATDEKELLDDICKIILSDCEYHSILIGITNDDSTSIRLGAHAGYKEEDVFNVIDLKTEIPDNFYPIKMAVQKKQVIINKYILTDPDLAYLKDDAIKREFASFSVIPLITPNKKVVGVLNIYATEPDAFVKEEIDLLQEIAGDLAYGIVSLRIKIERNKIQQELKESEELHRITLENILSPVFITDDDGTFTFISSNILHILGYTREDIEKMGNISNLLGDNFFDKKQLEKQRELSNIKRVIKCKDGNERVFLVSVNRVNIKGGTILYTCYDVTDLMQAEDELRGSEQRFRTLVSNIPGIVYRCAYDEHWTMYYISDFVEELSGYPATEFIDNKSRSFLSIIHSDDQAMVSDLIDKALAKRKAYVLEYRIVAVDGKIKWVYEKGQGVYNDQNQLLWLDGAIFDITDHKKAEAAREKLLKDLEKRNTEMERFIYTVSHDLKTPLVTIEGFVDCISLELDKETFTAFDDYINRIWKASKKMRQLLDELVDLSKVGVVIGPKEKIIFKDIIKEAIEDIGKISINVKIDTDFPIVYGDHRRLLEVIVNLLDNANKYIGDNSNPIVNIGFDVTKNAFYVKDNGIGISPKYFDKIFNLFEQLDTSIEGTGIGLCIVKKIIEHHQGNIWVDSKGIGEGSTFYFTIPDSPIANQ